MTDSTRNPVAKLVDVDDHGITYSAIKVWCPGCDSLHMLPVNSAVKHPQWTFDGNLDAPTLFPSILTHWDGEKDGVNTHFICHSFLEGGIWNFLSDSTHEFSGQQIPSPPLPDWTL